MLSEHPSVMALARPGARRGSLAAARRRISTVVPSAADSKSIASTISGGTITASKGHGSAESENTQTATASVETMKVMPSVVRILHATSGGKRRHAKYFASR